MTATTQKKPTANEAERELIYLGKQLRELKDVTRTEPTNPEEVVTFAECKGRIQEIEARRSELAKIILQEQAAREKNRAERATELKQDCAKMLGDLKAQIADFYAKNGPALEKMGRDYDKIRKLADELHRADRKHAYHGKKHAISYGNLINENAVVALLKTCLADSFNVPNVRGHHSQKQRPGEFGQPNTLTDELARLGAVEPL